MEISLPVAGNRVTILGLGVSGYAAAVFLASKNFKVFVSDQGASEAVLKKAQALRELGIETETGGHTFSRVIDCDWAILSPGIPPSAASIQALSQAGIPLFSEVEVASWFSPTSQVIAVTGSSGKTTVTTLLGRVMSSVCKGKVVVCGNIGNPWISEIPKLTKNDFVVVELSSFQLAYCRHFKPKVGLLLNLSPNHQDWHTDMQDYALAKLKIFQAQDSTDFAIVRKVDCASYFSAYSFKGKKIHLDDSAEAASNPNERAVRLTAEIFGCSQRKVTEVLESFEGIEHRLEKFLTHDHVTYVNDSKCTTTSSLSWALQKYADKTVILIAGGHPKSNDFSSIKALILQKVRNLVLIGEARPLLRQAWEGTAPFFETNDFSQAIRQARDFAKSGDTVLLSPACASFDMFQNYIERGKLFKQKVQEIVAESQPAAPANR